MQRVRVAIKSFARQCKYLRKMSVQTSESVKVAINSIIRLCEQGKQILRIRSVCADVAQMTAHPDRLSRPPLLLPSAVQGVRLSACHVNSCPTPCRLSSRHIKGLKTHMHLSHVSTRLLLPMCVEGGRGEGEGSHGCLATLSAH